MSTKKASPFAGLLGTEPSTLPKSAGTTVVVAGQRVTDARQLRPADVEDAADAEALKRELVRARNRARYQRDRQNPEAMAKRQAWYERNREKVRAYKRDYDQKNLERIRASQREWERRDYHANPEKHRESSRAYYARNRERILAALRAKTAAARAAKAGEPPAGDQQ